MALKEYSDGEVLFSSDLNNSFGHSGQSGTSPQSFTPTDATTNVFIIVKGNIELTSGSTLNCNVNLVSDQDGTLDTVELNAQESGANTIRLAFCLTYFGSLSAAAHSLSVTQTGSVTGTLENDKITILEFLA